MWNYSYDEDAAMNLRDSMKGVVRAQNFSGLYIDLEVEDEEMDGEKKMIPAFGYWSGKVKIGTEVDCTLKRWAKEEKDILVTIDSINYEKDMEMAA